MYLFVNFHMLNRSKEGDRVLIPAQSSAHQRLPSLPYDVTLAMQGQHQQVSAVQNCVTPNFDVTAKDSVNHASRTAAAQEQEYMNMAQSQVDSLYNDSVKYYVLENVNSWCFFPVFFTFVSWRFSFAS